MLLHDFTSEYTEYLRDESRLTGRAEAIAFPRNEDEVRQVLACAAKVEMTVTTQGARTGITAGAIPYGGCVINMGIMNRMTGMRYDAAKDRFSITVQPGVLLSELRDCLRMKQFDTADWSDESLKVLELFNAKPPCMFTPDPTETSATLGGMAACNASGARSYFYGPIRRHILSMRVITAKGEILILERGVQTAQGLNFRLQTESMPTEGVPTEGVPTEGVPTEEVPNEGVRAKSTSSQGMTDSDMTGTAIYEGILPAYGLRDIKNASGYYAHKDMDLVDLFIGSEGSLGIITEIELALLSEPAMICGLVSFFDNEESSVSFVKSLREYLHHESPGSARLVAIEYFNSGSLDLLRRQKLENPAFSEIPDMKPGYRTAIYTEYHGDDEDAVMDMMTQASEIMAGCGGGEDDTWVAWGAKELERLIYFRHAVPESVNLAIDFLRRKDSGLAKLGTDMAVPDEYLNAALSMYNRGIYEHSLDAVMFGHIGDNHIHVNILPRNADEYAAGRKLYKEWAAEICRMGGTISAEHGVGKLKTELLQVMYGDVGIAAMRAIKEIFDPGYMLNRGNLFAPDDFAEKCGTGQRVQPR